MQYTTRKETMATVLTPLFHGGGEARREIMESKVKAFGHPIHPMLIVFPLGLLATSLIFDIIHWITGNGFFSVRSEEHTSELQSRLHLVCRLLLEKKNISISLIRT